MPRLPQDVVELLEFAARHPEGGSALLEGHLESVAALYQLHPAKVEHVRNTISKTGHRAHAEAILSGAGAQAPRSSTEREARTDAQALIAHAATTPHGLEFLTRAPIENAAVIFESHPFVVDQARTHLAGGAR